MPYTAVAWDELVGRETERALMSSFLARAAERGAALALAGQAGVGKTAILAAAQVSARNDGYLVLSASGAQFESAIGFAILNQLLAPTHGRVEALDPDAASTLATVLGHTPRDTVTPAAVTDAVLRLLDVVRASAPVLLLIDDWQWVDRSTAEVLTALALRAAGLRVGVLVAYRSDGDPVDVCAFASAEVLPLSRESAAELLDRRHPGLGPRARARLLAESAGFPLALVELPSVLSAAQRQDRAALPSVLPLGHRLRSVFAGREGSLLQPARRLLLLAALDGPAHLADLAQALALDVDALRTGEDLAAALGSELVALDRSAATGERLVFRHPLLRATVIDSATADEQRWAHTALGRAHGKHLERSAWHLAESVRGPDENVALLLERTALLALRRGDGIGALNALIRSGELSPAPPDRHRRLAHAAYLGTDVTGDLERANALVDAIRHSEAEVSLPAAVAAAHALLVGTGDLTTAHHLLVTSLNVHATADGNDLTPADRLAALYSLFEVCTYGARPEMWAPLRAAVDELGADAPTDLRLMMTVLADPARATDDALAELDGEISRVTEERDPTAIERVATSALFVDRAHPCHPGLWQVIEDGRSGGAVTSAVNAAMVLWADEYHSGHWDSCSTLSEEGQDLCRRHGLHLFTAPLQYGAGLVAAGRGDHVGARHLADAIDLWAAPRGMHSVQCFGWHVRALAACGQGDFADAHRLFRQVSPGGTVPQNLPEALWMIFDLVESAVRSDHGEYALAHIRSVDELNVARISSRLALVCAGARALIVDPARSGEHFESALGTPGSSQWPFDLARVELAYGEHLRRRRSPREARQHLSSALAIFRTLRAAPWVERTIGEMRATGTQDEAPLHLERPDQGRLRHGLTPQELQIATLVAAGLTNKEIAERLLLSPRTVAAHLRQVFPKLQINSRAAMRDALDARAGASGPR